MQDTIPVEYDAKEQGMSFIIGTLRTYGMFYDKSSLKACY